MIFTKVIFLQLLWFIFVYFGSKDLFQGTIFLTSLALVVINYFFIASRPTFIRYLILVLLFLVWGQIHDGLLFWLKIMKPVISSKEYFFAPLWLSSLWLVFLCYYGDIFDKFSHFPIWQLALIGMIGGCMAYYSGSSFGGFIINNMPLFLLVVSLSWSIFFPVSIKLFYSHIQT